MSTTICFDFGNTRLKAAIFTNASLIELRVLETGSIQEIEKLVAEFAPEKTILSSVIHHDKAVETLLSKSTQFHLLGPSTQINFTTPVGKPETIGADRLALIAAAVDQFPNEHNLVISLGTCITYNFINNTHAFLGGSISQVCKCALKQCMNKLPFCPLLAPPTSFPWSVMILKPISLAASF